MSGIFADVTESAAKCIVSILPVTNSAESTEFAANKSAVINPLAICVTPIEFDAISEAPTTFSAILAAVIAFAAIFAVVTCNAPM